MPRRAIQVGEDLAGIADLVKRGQPAEDENGPFRGYMTRQTKLM